MFDMLQLVGEIDGSHATDQRVPAQIEFSTGNDLSTNVSTS
ncbi:MAG TPA: hypothetical protein VJU84_03925 [Pyrinomonadaceae bacterium]|nr:hypothetical protein [Pyrinomonadaceae bacterium]